MRASEASSSTDTKGPGWSVGHRVIASDALIPKTAALRHSAAKVIPATSTVVGTVLVAGITFAGREITINPDQCLISQDKSNGERASPFFVVPCLG
jgi:hypothetical protein